MTAALDTTTWLGGYDLTGDSRSTALQLEVEPLVDTRFGMSGQSRVGGLHSTSTTVEGYTSYGAGEVDAQLHAGLAQYHVITQSPDGEEGSVAYFWQARTFSFATFGDVGAVIPFSLQASSGRGNGRVHGTQRGRILKTRAEVSATGATGTPYELGAVTPGRYLYAAFHVFGTPGTTVTAVLESSADDTFAAATTRMTFGPITTAGGTWGTRVAGPITDTWYRLRVTAITGTFTIACAAGFK